MPRIANTTDRQSKFLRSLRGGEHGPRVLDWPSPVILRRWLRRPGFIAAMESVQDSIRRQADFQLSSSSISAMGKLQQNLDSVADASPEQIRMLRVLTHLLRVTHQREGFLAKNPSRITANANPDAENPQRPRERPEAMTPHHRQVDAEARKILTG